MKKMLAVIFTIIFIIVIIPLIGRMIINEIFEKKVALLDSQSKNIASKKINFEDIKNLPKSVQLYFRHVLKDGQPYINSTRLTHNGLFKNDLKKPWLKIKGEEYFITGKPGYVWNGTTAFYSAIDSYVQDKGNLSAYLFNIFKVADGKGEKYNQGELLRWLAESVCFPTNLLPRGNLQWSSINDSSAKINFEHDGISIYYVVYFNERNEIYKMETERYMDDGDLEKWVTYFSDYKQINGVVVPIKLEAGWEINSTYFSYAKFYIQKIAFQ